MIEFEAWRQVATMIRAGWNRLPRTVRRLFLAVAGALTVLFGTAAVAQADGGHQGPAGMEWLKLTDSHGISIWSFQLSLDEGGKLDIGQHFWVALTQVAWGIYSLVVSVTLWLIDYALSFDWLNLIAGPAGSIADALHQVVVEIGIVPTLLTITALMAGLWIFRGRWATGIFEVFMSCLIAALATGVLGNPVDLVAGKDHGLLYGARDTAFAIAGGMADQDPGTSSTDVRHVATEQVASTFIRQPHQLVNYGKVLDGGKCEKVYDDALRKSTADDTDDVRDKIGDCDSAAGDYAENPSVGAALTAGMFMPAAWLLLALGVLLAGTVFVSGFYALFAAVKLVVVMLAGMLPGSSRGPLWMTLADLVISLVTVVFSVVFLTAYMLVLQAVFNQQKMPGLQLFLLIDVFLIVGCIVFWKGRARLKAATNRLAEAMSRRPGGGRNAPQQPRKFSASDVYYKARVAKATGGAVARGAASLAGGRDPAAKAAVKDVRSRIAETKPHTSGRSKLKTAGHVAAAWVSGGTTAAASAATKKAATSQAAQHMAQSGPGSARRRRVEARIQASRTPAPRPPNTPATPPPRVVSSGQGTSPSGQAEPLPVTHQKVGRRRPANPKVSGPMPSTPTVSPAASAPAASPSGASGLPPTHTAPTSAVQQLRSKMQRHRDRPAGPTSTAAPISAATRAVRARRDPSPRRRP